MEFPGKEVDKGSTWRGGCHGPVRVSDPGSRMLSCIPGCLPSSRFPLGHAHSHCNGWLSLPIVVSALELLPSTGSGSCRFKSFIVAPWGLLAWGYPWGGKLSFAPPLEDSHLG